MVYVYVLRSLSHPGYYYKGSCTDLLVRLKQHNNGKTRSNKHYLPFEVAYFESASSLLEARQREKYWKTAAGRRYLQPILERHPKVLFLETGCVVQWIE